MIVEGAAVAAVEVKNLENQSVVVAVTESGKNRVHVIESAKSLEKRTNPKKKKQKWILKTKQLLIMELKMAPPRSKMKWKNKF